MELKTTVSLIVFTVTAFGIISAPAILITDKAFAIHGKNGISISSHSHVSVHINGKSVSTHSNHGKSSSKSSNGSSEKYTPGFYTDVGHHHCKQGTSGCHQTSHFKK